jgi:3,5-epimerase/4-reductase
MILYIYKNNLFLYIHIMKLLIYGYNGWIGSQFIDQCKKEKIEYYCGTIHCENTIELMDEIETINPTHIVSFIGRTHGDKFTTIDYLEQPGKLDINIRDNLFSPLSLAILCKDRNIHYTYLGTGCIFEYDEQHTLNQNLFTEQSLPNFKGSSYSTVKGYTDQLMHLFENSVLNLRIRMPIVSCENPRNFITKIVNYEKVCSIQNSMTVLDEFIPIFLDMIKNNRTGTYNCTNPGTIEHNEILQMYKEIVNPEFTWKNFTIEEQDKILLGKRSNNHLDTSKIKQIYPHLKDIKISVRECLHKMILRK